VNGCFGCLGVLSLGGDTGMQRVDMTSFWSRESRNNRMSTNNEDELSWNV